MSLEDLRKGGYGTIGNRKGSIDKFLDEKAINLIADSVIPIEERMRKSEELYQILKRALEKSKEVIPL